jgi:hypothetical protein
MKTLIVKLNSIPTTVKLLIALTLFYFIGKTLGNR